MTASRWLQPFTPHRLSGRSLAFDLAVAVLLTVYLHLATFGWHGYPEIGYLVEGAIVACRRLWPPLAAVGALAVAATSEVTAWPFPLAVAVIVYTVAARKRTWQLAAGYAALAAILLIAPSPYADLTHPRQLGQIIPEAVMLTGAPLLAGFYQRQRQDMIAATLARADDAGQRLLLQAEHSRAAERNRLAQELHDVLAHSMGLIIVHSGALTLTSPDPGTREIAEHLRTIGATALEELRDIIAVLREDDTAPLTPSATLADLPLLIRQAQIAGQTVAFGQSGTPRRVPGPIERTAYLVIDHSLTHARQHTPDARVQVTADWQPTALDITVIVHIADTTAAVALPDFLHLNPRISLLAGTLTVSSDHHSYTIKALLPA